MFRWFRILRSRFSPQFIRADLYSVLHAANPNGSIEEKIEWFESLIEWVRLPASPEAVAQKTDRIEASRVRFLLQMLERRQELQTKVSETLQAVLLESDSVDLYFATGIELQHGFARELADRAVGNIMPRYREAKSLKQTFETVFASEEDVQWLRELNDKDLENILKLIFADQVALATFRAKQVDAMHSAIQLLTARLAGLAVDSDLRARLPHRDVNSSPFFQLQQQQNSLNHLRAALQLCWKDIESVYLVLETAGVSIDLVYKIDAIKSILRRIDLLSALRAHVQSGEANTREYVRFMAELADLHVQRASLTAFLSSSLNLIARKIVERTSQTGEHYITRSAVEYKEMFVSATGGGFVTMFTTVVKVGIGKLQLPLFFDGLFSTLNYALSFSAIQLLGFTLATKTPAMTASSLASKLRDLSTQTKINEFVEEVVCLVRSTFAAVIGNLGMVIPAAIAFDMFWYGVAGSHLMTSENGVAQMAKHSPLQSLTIWYAALTGLFLWGSSIMGAWLENWFVYRKQFEFFENSLGVRRRLGERRQKVLGSFLRRNIAGLGTNVFLGFMLAFCGVVGDFFGLPLEVRHVTLSTGTLTFGLLAIENVREHLFVVISAVSGIAIIGLLNFGVSFTLSLFVAARARDIRLRNFPFLFRLILNRFIAGPMDFFFPRRT
jgi:site-specific recombinase